MTDCSGPCLKHCYKTQYLYYIIVFLLGMITMYMLTKNKNTNKNKLKYIR